MNIAEKNRFLSVLDQDNTKKIVVTHVTIRQSIFFLLLKLIIIEVTFSGLVIFLHIVLSSSDIQTALGNEIDFFNIPLFVIVVLLKLCVMLMIIIQWLEEYYEITPREIMHNSGFLFKKQQSYQLVHLSKLTVEQGFLGRIFNYGTIRLYNWTQENDVLLYLIHNPLKYEYILKTLIPEVDEDKQVFREHLIYNERTEEGNAT